MHRRPYVRSAGLGLVGLVLVGLAVVGGWLVLRDRPVQVRPAVSAADPACATLAGSLPPTVAAQPRRATSSDSPGVAAWGDPAVIWLCGVLPPGPSTDCLEVNGVDWVVERLDDGTAFTTFGRDPAVQVLVPRAYAPEPLRLPALSAVVATLPQGRRRCT